MSIIALWVLVLFETVLLLLLLRALGELRQKGSLAPDSASAEQASELGGLDVGERAPSFVATDFDGNTIRLDDYQGQRCILAFISPGCSFCKGTIDALNIVLHEEPDVKMLVIGSTEYEQNRKYAAEHEALMPVLTPASNISRDLYHVQIVPFVFALDETGVVQARGLVSKHERLQELLKEAFSPVAVARS